MRKRQLGEGCAEWFFQRVVTEELVFFNSAIQPGLCQGAPAYEEAKADALATSPRPGLLGNTQHNYVQMPGMYPGQQTRQIQHTYVSKSI